MIVDKSNSIQIFNISNKKRLKMTMESNTKVSLFLSVPSERAIEENITGFTLKVNTVENRQKRL